jgi:S1-C subfamily serine protease
MQQKKKKRALVILAVIAGVWLVVGAGVLGAWLSSQATQKNNSLTSGVDGNQVVTEDEADLANIVKKVGPTVVSVVTTQTTGSGRFQTTSEGAGTGIIVSADGYILTNRHVVQDARTLEIINSEGERYSDVTLVGSDPLNDIAILKIKGAKDLPAAELGDSGTVRVGQRVIAIGNSLGQYQNTVTSGIISGLGRPVTAATDELGMNVESLTDLLQTDAAINPGNSGGPLINMAGQVIGINTAIVSDAQSVGFAIPINAARGIIRGVLADGTIQKAYLGVQFVAITPDIRAELNLSERNGALVKSGTSGQAAVISGGPADKAGIREGDIITKVDDRVVGEQGGLGSLIAEFLPGEKVTLTIIRDGKTQEVSVTLGSYES